MMMTDAEIIREYREAAKPMKQIGILADENQCSRGKIVDILREAGMELPAVYREKRPYSPESGAEPQAAPLENSGETSLPNRNDMFRFGEEGPGQSSSIAANAAMRSIDPSHDEAPRLVGFSERVNDGAIEVIARMVADSDSGQDQENEVWHFRERVRGVLALVHELRGGYGE